MKGKIGDAHKQKERDEIIEELKNDESIMNLKPRGVSVESKRDGRRREERKINNDSIKSSNIFSEYPNEKENWHRMRRKNEGDGDNDGIGSSASSKAGEFISPSPDGSKDGGGGEPKRN